MTPIKPVSITETKNFGQVPVNEFWLEIPAGASSGAQDKKYLDHIKHVLDSVKDGVICVFSEELSSKPLCEALANARDNGSRIYILTNDYNSEMKILEGCLIRYGGNKKLGSFILINPNSNEPTGCLFTGRLSEGSINLPVNLLLDLDNTQVSTLFRYFCYQFWDKNLVKKERIGNEERDVGTAPIDIYPPAEDTCDFEYLKSVWNKETENAMITTSLLNENAYLRYNNFSNSTIISLLSGIDDSLVRSLKQRNNEIYAYNDVTLINSIKLSNGIWLIPKIDAAHEEEVYAILLNSEQIQILNKHIITLSQRTPQYVYFANDTRGNLSDKTIFYLGNSVSQKILINPENRITVQLAPPSELLSKEKFENLKPDFDDDGRSVSITYEWENKPFALPKGSVKHQLYKDWENAEKAIINYRDDILNAISENEKEEGKLSRLIKLLFLGKKQKFSEYRGELENLKTIEYSSTEKSALEKYIKRINEIRNLVDKDSNEIKAANQKAEIQEEIDAREAEKTKREEELKNRENDLQETEEKIKIQTKEQNELKKQLENINNEKKEISDKIASLELEIKKIADKDAKCKEDLAAKEKELREKKKNLEKEPSLQKEMKAIEDKIATLESEIEEIADQKENIEGELADKNEDLQRKEDPIKALSDKLEKQGQQLADMGVTKTRITGEITNLNTQIKNIANKIDSRRDELKRPVKEAPKDGSALSNLKGGGKKQNQSGPINELSVPQFPRLPHPGELFQHNGQNYLAITDWEDYDKGKAEAKRLDAKLCVKGENNG
jgi:predicted  nucleic acid-binding Zn-ribbon protein